jgi:hypothetical protein
MKGLYKINILQISKLGVLCQNNLIIVYKYQDKQYICINKINKMENIEKLKIELCETNRRIDKINNVSDYTDAVLKSFHLGMVGGSGKNNYKLNKKREASLNKTIDNAKIITVLYKKQGELEAKIKDIEMGGPEKRAERVKTKNQMFAEYWKNLKVGDELKVGNPSGNPIIVKKNSKSCETQGGCKWSAWEIIGKEAANLI